MEKSNFDAIIGVGYKKGMGKDTLADFLVKDWGYTKISFAKRLKDVAILLFGFTHEQVYDEKLKETVDPYWGFTPRWALQKLGTDACRNNIDPEIWVKCAFKLAMDSGARKIVIPDMRFPNELEAITKRGGIAVKIHRKCIDTSDPSYQHVSETILDDYQNWDAIVENDADMEFLDIAATALDSLALMEERSGDSTLRITPASGGI